MPGAPNTPASACVCETGSGCYQRRDEVSFGPPLQPFSSDFKPVGHGRRQRQLPLAAVTYTIVRYRRCILRWKSGHRLRWAVASGRRRHAGSNLVATAPGRPAACSSPSPAGGCGGGDEAIGRRPADLRLQDRRRTRPEYSKCRARWIGRPPGAARRRFSNRQVRRTLMGIENLLSNHSLRKSAKSSRSLKSNQQELLD